MSFARTPRWLFRMKGLGLSELKLAGELYGFASKKNYRAWPSREKLCDLLGISKSTLARAKMGLARAKVLCFRHDPDKGMVHSIWMAVNEPGDFRIETKGKEFSHFRALKSRPTAPKRPNPLTHQVTRTKNTTPTHLVSRAPSHQVSRTEPGFQTKNPVKIIGFSVPKEPYQTSRTDHTLLGAQKDARRDEGMNGGTEAGKEKSSMLDGQVAGGVTGGAAPPPGRRADADQSQVSLDDFTETPKKRKGKALADQNSPTSKLLAAFCAAYRERFGITYRVAWGRDMKLSKSLAADFPLDILTLSIKLYFADKDPFLAKEGYPFSLLAMRANKYAFQARRQTKGRSGYESKGVVIGTRVLVKDDETETVHRVFTAEGWEFETVTKPKPKAEKPIMDAGEEFE